MTKEGEGAVVRQTHLIAVVEAFMIGCTFVLLVGCSGDTGSQQSGSQDSEVSQSEQTGSERTGPRESESTHEVTQHGGSLEAIPPTLLPTLYSGLMASPTTTTNTVG